MSLPYRKAELLKINDLTSSIVSNNSVKSVDLTPLLFPRQEIWHWRVGRFAGEPPVEG